MLVAATLSLGCLALGVSCKAPDKTSKDPLTVNAKLYKAGFGDDFANVLEEKFNAAFEAEGYKLNISSRERSNQGSQTLNDLYDGVGKNDIDLYITGAITPNMVSEDGIHERELVEDLKALVFDKPAINYDGSYSSDNISDRLSSDLMPYMMADNGKTYGFTWAQTSAGLVVNVKKLAKYGFTELPRTTNEMFAMFDAIADGANGIPDKTQSKTYPLAYCLAEAATYQSCAFTSWFAQFGIDTYNEFLRMQTQENGVWTDMQNGYEVFSNPDIIDVYEAGYKLLDKKYKAPGSESQNLDTIQSLIMQDEAANNSAVFMLNGDWFLNEVKENYTNLSDITFINTPVISALGVKQFGANTKYALDDATCDKLLSAICKLVDENKTVAEIKAEIEAHKDFGGLTLDDADIEAIAYARGTSVARGIEHLAFIAKDSAKKEIAALVLRMMASDDFARTFMETANASSPYTQSVKVETPYDFVREAQRVTANRYFRAVNSRIQGLRYEVLRTDSIMPAVSENNQLIRDMCDNTIDYRTAAENLCKQCYDEAKKAWEKYFSKK